MLTLLVFDTVVGLSFKILLKAGALSSEAVNVIETHSEIRERRRGVMRIMRP